ncbi:MAG: hypothetical protein ACI4IL_00555 [Eubacterium sp.]
MFNQYQWELYLNAGGKNIVNMFERNLTEEFTEEYIEKIVEFHKSYCPSKNITDIIENDLYSILEGYGIDTCANLKELKSLIKNEIYKQNISDKTLFEEFSAGISYYTTLLAYNSDFDLIPYYFKYNFNVLEKICIEFKIDIPNIPIKKDYIGRYNYYEELCKSFLIFRQNNNMTAFEFLAFLYDYAPKLVGGTDYIINTLPEPKSAFFIGAQRNDAFFSTDKNWITPWQCNAETRAGDLLVMYMRYPDSCVNSVWRSVSLGFNDPFFEYYRCAYISNSTEFTPFSKTDMEQDSVFKDLPIVRKNMQGVNGVELSPSQYNHLVEITKADVPKLEYTVINNDVAFTREKDVENKLIIPLIEKLDYNSDDWIPQMQISIGNHNTTLIPDFVILPNHKEKKAFAIIEAKLTIQNKKELSIVRDQAKSYARQLLAEYCIIASKEKIWIYSNIDNNDYIDEVFSASWEELNNADCFQRIYKKIGKC